MAIVYCRFVEAAGLRLAGRFVMAVRDRISFSSQWSSKMQDLINRVVQNVGIDASTAQPAIGMFSIFSSPCCRTASSLN